jgi:hypothetical protein
VASPSLDSQMAYREWIGEVTRRAPATAQHGRVDVVWVAGVDDEARNIDADEIVFGHM